MSGPKCGEWSVESNLERERRIAAELRTRIRGLQNELEGVKATWWEAKNRFGDEFPSSPPKKNSKKLHDSASTEELRSHEDLLRIELTSHREALSDAEATHRVRDLLQSIAENQPHHERIVPAKNTGSGRQVGNDTISKRKETVARLVERLDPSVPVKERGWFERNLKDAAAQVGTSRFEGLMLELRLTIQTLNAQQETRAHGQYLVHKLASKLIGLEGTEVDRLKQELREVQLGRKDLRSGFQAELDKVVSSASAVDDRQYASKVILEELKRLGYSVEVGMETVLVNGGELEVTKPELREYSVRFLVDQNSELFDVRLKREGDAGEVVGSERRLLDRSMEEKWCSDFASALSSAAERGVDARITKREKPGVVPVEVTTGTGRKRSRSKHRAFSQQKFREHRGPK